MVALGLRTLLGEWSELTSFYHAAKDGEVDCALHTDFILKLRSGIWVPLQVKSSRKSAKKFSKNYPRIIVIVVKRRHGQKDLASMIKKQILDIYRLIKIEALPR